MQILLQNDGSLSDSLETIPFYPSAFVPHFAFTLFIYIFSRKNAAQPRFGRVRLKFKEPLHATDGHL